MWKKKNKILYLIVQLIKGSLIYKSEVHILTLCHLSFFDKWELYFVAICMLLYVNHIKYTYKKQININLQNICKINA